MIERKREEREGQSRWGEGNKRVKEERVCMWGIDYRKSNRERER